MAREQKLNVTGDGLTRRELHGGWGRGGGFSLRDAGPGYGGKDSSCAPAADLGFRNEIRTSRFGTNL